MKMVYPNSNSLRIDPIEEGYYVNINIRDCQRLVCENSQTFNWCWECPR